MSEKKEHFVNKNTVCGLIGFVFALTSLIFSCLSFVFWYLSIVALMFAVAGIVLCAIGVNISKDNTKGDEKRSGWKKYLMQFIFFSMYN